MRTRWGGSILLGGADAAGHAQLPTLPLFRSPPLLSPPWPAAPVRGRCNVGFSSRPPASAPAHTRHPPPKKTPNKKQQTSCAPRGQVREILAYNVETNISARVDLEVGVTNT